MSEFIVDEQYSLVYIDEENCIYSVTGIIDKGIDIHFVMESVI